jgi:uncharacterized protein GlcG (DUF336 family)
MTNVIKKHSISSELAQRMVDEAVAKARTMGVSENVAVLDDGGNLKAFHRMDGAPILSIETAQKASAALFGVPTQDFFDFIQRDPSLLAGIDRVSRARVALCCRCGPPSPRGGASVGRTHSDSRPRPAHPNRR